MFYDTITCYQWTSLPIECSKQVFLLRRWNITYIVFVLFSIEFLSKRIGTFYFICFIQCNVLGFRDVLPLPIVYNVSTIVAVISQQSHWQIHRSCFKLLDTHKHMPAVKCSYFLLWTMVSIKERSNESCLSGGYVSSAVYGEITPLSARFSQWRATQEKRWRWGGC